MKVDTVDTTFDLVAIGDLMIDFTCLGPGPTGMLTYERNPGGAPMNVAAQVVRLGGRAAAVACVGADEHGEFLKDTMRDLGVDTANIASSSHEGTRMLFVYFRDGGDRYFTGNHGPRADLMLHPDMVDLSVVRNSRVLLLSPLCNSYTRPIYKTAQEALRIADEHGVPLAFDANYRFPYEDERLRQLDIELLNRAQILKLTEDEFEYYLNESDIMRGTEKLLSNNARIVAVSMGAEGCFIRNRNGHVRRPAYSVDAIDTTGAGDSFMGALIHRLTRPGADVDSLDTHALGDIAEFANACAGASTTRRGSLLVMPDRITAERVREGISV